MLNIKTKNRLLIFLTICLLSIVLITFVFKTLEDNVLYFYSPSDIDQNEKIKLNKNIRIGGMVKNGSVKTEKNEIKFIVTDYKKEIIVSYKGTVPALFAACCATIAAGIATLAASAAASIILPFVIGRDTSNSAARRL